MPDQRSIKVAIIGGGCASMAAAFELSRPEHKGAYEITVYQVGWRLGGKGASGRGVAGRIEEHGFHVWFGFYENAFRLMRECYAELNRDRRKCRIADWRDAFFPAPFASFPDRAKDGSFSARVFCLPASDGLPGDPISDGSRLSVTEYLIRASSLLRMMVLGLRSHANDVAEAHSQAGASAPGGLGTAKDEDTSDLQTRIAQLMKYGSIATVAGLVEAAGILELAFKARSFYPIDLIVGLMEATVASARRLLETFIGDDPEMLVLWQAIELVLTAMIGILRFGLISDSRGFDAINDYDFREWLRINGCSARTLQSPLMQVWYDMAFAYENGDHQRPSQGAGIGLRGGVRLLFGYRGAPFWKMSAGMGDVMFAPLYELLKRRGVSFRFFHRLENVRVADVATLSPGERPYVEALEFDVQALVQDGKEYFPLVDIDGLPCWPSKPDYSQLMDGDMLQREERNFESHWDRRKVETKTLRVVDDFDFVVLGIGLGAVPYVCKELIQRDVRWREMVAHVKTVETQALQLWMSEDMEALGWNGPSVSMCGFVQPFESWGDMRHLVREERWLKNRGSIAYFVSTLSDLGAPPPDCNYPSVMHDEVRRNAIRFLNHDVVQIWPKAARGPGQFRWEILLDANGGELGTGESRFDSQYWRANVNPSERYVLSVPNSQKYRISPLDNTYDNMTVAGDWTACGYDVGCVEAAVMSGKLAAHALSALPALEDIIGYDHP